MYAGSFWSRLKSFPEVDFFNSEVFLVIQTHFTWGVNMIETLRIYIIPLHYLSHINIGDNSNNKFIIGPIIY